MEIFLFILAEQSCGYTVVLFLKGGWYKGVGSSALQYVFLLGGGGESAGTENSISHFS